jgi:hypothetical protein
MNRVIISMSSAGAIDPIETPSGNAVLCAPPGGSFNYGNLSTDQITDLRNRAASIRQKARTTTRGIIEIGRDLLAVKKELGHGEFLIWAETECGLSIRTAENYMRAAKFMEGRKFETVSNLTPALIYKLAAKNTPPGIIDEVISVTESGGVVSEGKIRKKLANAAAERRQAERQAKRQARKARRGSKAAHEREELERQARLREQKATEAAVAIWRNQVGEKAAKATYDLFKAAPWPWGLIEEIEKQLRERAA